MKKCAIFGCGSNSINHPEKKFFFVPKDQGTKGLWIHTTGKPYSIHTNFVVCDEHFDVSFSKPVNPIPLTRCFIDGRGH